MEEPRLLHAMVAFPPRDTIRFDLPAATLRCVGEKSTLLQAVSPEGSGVLIRLRYRDSLVADSYPVVSPDDKATVPAATVTVRYFLREAPHAFVMDSGTVRVRRTRTKVSGRVEGTGLENAIRTPARIEYKNVPLRSDTVTCGYAR
jgi:hypothetical protein